MVVHQPVPPSRCRTPGERINYVRSERNLSWQQIDRLCGLSAGHTRTLWVRKSKGRVDTIRKIATALGLPFDWLAFGAGPAPSRREVKEGQTSSEGAPTDVVAPSPPAAA